MAAREITVVKQEYKTGDGTKLFLSSKTKVEADANGKYVPGSATTTLSLHDTGGNILGDSKPVATRGADGNWVLTKDGNGNIVAGLDLQKSLSNRNSMLNVNLNNHIKQSMGAPLQGVPAGQVNNNKPNDVASAIGIGTNTASGSGTTSADPAALNAAIAASSGTRNKFPTLKYPENLEAAQQDVIKFSMLKYSPKAFQTTKDNLGGFADRPSIGKDRNAIGVVTLPIPNGILDSNAVTWGSDSMNAGEALLANVALTTIKQGFTAGAEVISAAAPAATTPGAQTWLAAAFAAAATNLDGGRLLSRTEGAILNPNMELLFQSPTLRPFNFTFKLASRSEDESKTIRSIIRFFKQGMSPQRSKSNLFLKAPHTFQIQYLHRDEEHKFLNQFKECALQSFSVSYTPEGQYATFTDGAMVSYQITMQFQELEPIFNDDYTNDGTNPSPDIGY